MKVLLREYERGVSGQDWPSGSCGGFGEGLFWRANRRAVMSSSGCGDTKGPVCPSLAHALHSHTQAHSERRGPGRKGAFLLAQSLACPPLSASIWEVPGPQGLCSKDQR